MRHFSSPAYAETETETDTETDRQPDKYRVTERDRECMLTLQVVQCAIMLATCSQQHSQEFIGHAVIQ